MGVESPATPPAHSPQGWPPSRLTRGLTLHLHESSRNDKWDRLLPDALHRLRRLGSVQLGVDLRHDRGRNAPGRPGPRPGRTPLRSRVAALWRSWLGCQWVDARPCRHAVARSPAGRKSSCVRALPGALLRPTPSRRFCCEGWTGVFRSLPHARPAAPPSLRGVEQVGRQLGPEPRPEDRLGLGAEVDPSLPAVMLRLVALGGVDPDPARRVEVARPHACKPLPAACR